MKRSLNLSQCITQLQNRMRYSIRTLFVFITIIFWYELVMCSAISLQQDFHMRRSQSRRLLASVTSFPANDLKKLSAAFKETDTSVEASLRKRPPSSSNPTQN